MPALALTRDWLYFEHAGKLTRFYLRNFQPSEGRRDDIVLGMVRGDFPLLEPGETVSAITARSPTNTSDQDDIAVQTSNGRILYFDGRHICWHVVPGGS